MHSDFGIAYYNCGDWVESCTALVEHHDGRFEIIRWADRAAEALLPRSDAPLRTHRGVSNAPIRLVLVTDAWRPQVNGVVNSLDRVVRHAARAGRRGDRHRARPVPHACRARPIRRSRLRWRGRARSRGSSKPIRAAFVHIATEGPLGILARRHCLARRRAFTTSYHTKFPEYLSARVPVPHSWGYAFMRWFHNAGRGCMVATASLGADLAAPRLQATCCSGRAASTTTLFRPRAERRPRAAAPDLPLRRSRRGGEEPRGVPEARSCPARKVVVGDGPARAELTRRLSAGALPRRAADRGARRGLCGRRRLRLPEPHRHVRQRDAGGAGVRAAGRGLSGDRAEGHHHRSARRHARQRPPQGGPCGAQAVARRGARIRALASAGKRAPPSSATTSSPPTA